MMSLFTGAWLLVSQHTVYPDGSSALCRGENPAGIIIYDASGYMSVQLMRTDEHARDYTDMTSFRTAMDGYHSYFGRYKVDEDAKIVRHFVEGSAYFDYRGTTQVRHYAFDGDTLTLQAGADDGTRRVIVWRRATAG